MVPKILMVGSAAILFGLGLIHFIYTYWGQKLFPRDPALQISMSQISPILTNETTMWQCWVGFNASHSMGAMLFGLVYGYLAIAHTSLLFRSPFLLVVGFAMLAGYFVLGKAYWFSIPFAGISISLACFIAAIVLERFLTTSQA